MMMNEEYPSRPQRHVERSSPRRARCTPEGPEGPEGSSSSDRCDPSKTAPQHHALSADEHEVRVFDFLYRVIFSMVHMALSTILSPVLDGRGGGKRRRKPEPSRQQPSSYPDPELAMPPSTHSEDIHHHDNDRGTINPSYSPILKTESSTRHCRVPSKSDLSTGERKSVRFPAPERTRIPLGRIGLSSSSSLGSQKTGSSCSNGSSVCSAGSSRSLDDRAPASSQDTGRSSRGYMPQAINSASRHPAFGGRRIRTRSPLGRALAAPRMRHSTYFLE